MCTAPLCMVVEDKGTWMRLAMQEHEDKPHLVRTRSAVLDTLGISVHKSTVREQHRCFP